MSKIFQLNFLGVPESNQHQSQELKVLMMENFGITAEQVAEIFLNAPVTLLESPNEAEIKPIYDFLKSYNAPVIIEVVTEDNESELQFAIEDADDIDPEADLAPLPSAAIKVVEDDQVIFDFEGDSEEDSKKTNSVEPAPRPEVLNVKESASEDEVTFSFEDGEETDPTPIPPEAIAAPIKIKEDVAETTFSFEGEEETPVVESTPEASPPPAPNTSKHEEDTIFSFEGDEEEASPVLQAVPTSAILPSEAIQKNNPAGSESDAPLKSSSLKLNFNIKPKDQIFLEENHKKQSTTSAVKDEDTKSEDTKSKDGAAQQTEKIASTGFDNVVYTASHITNESYRPKKKLISSEVLQYLIPILVGCTLVTVGTIFLFPEPEVVKPIQVAKTTVSQPEETTPVEIAQTNEDSAVYSKYFGVSDQQKVKVEGTITRYNDELRNISLEITPPPPVALTPEDLVLNKKLPPWIEKFTLEQFKLSPSKDLYSFTGMTKARLFVTFDQQEYRFVAPVAVRAILNKETNKVKVALVLKFGIKEPPANKLDYFIDIAANGRHKIYLKSIFDANLQTDADKAAPAQ